MEIAIEEYKNMIERSGKSNPLCSTCEEKLRNSEIPEVDEPNETSYKNSWKTSIAESRETIINEKFNNLVLNILPESQWKILCGASIEEGDKKKQLEEIGEKIKKKINDMTEIKNNLQKDVEQLGQIMENECLLGMLMQKTTESVY